MLANTLPFTKVASRRSHTYTRTVYLIRKVKKRSSQCSVFYLLLFSGLLLRWFQCTSNTCRSTCIEIDLDTRGLVRLRVYFIPNVYVFLFICCEYIFSWFSQSHLQLSITIGLNASLYSLLFHRIWRGVD